MNQIGSLKVHQHEPNSLPTDPITPKHHQTPTSTRIREHKQKHLFDHF